VTYAFTVFSEGQLLTGELVVKPKTPVEQVTRTVVHRCAQVACVADAPWDPFNMRITLIKKPTPRRKKPAPCN
jgi:hypothetical protein